MTKLYTEEADGAPYSELQMVDQGTPPLLSKRQTFLMNFTQFGLNFMVLLLSVVVVPAQMEALVGGSAKGSCLGGLVAGGAAVTFLVSPMIGMVSDRIKSRLGKRRPVMLMGTAFMCVGLLGMAFSAPQLVIERSPKGSEETAFNNTETCIRDLAFKRCLPFSNLTASTRDIRLTGGTPPGGVILPRKDEGVGSEKIIEEDYPGNTGLYILFFLIVISSQAAISVPFNALVADKSHPSQRGFNSGVMGAMILLGNVSGAAAGLSFTHIGILSIYGVIIAVIVLSVAVTVVVTKEHSGRDDGEKKKLGCKVIFAGFWSPLKEHDFRWVFITRFLMQQGVATITGFLEYWLDDMVQLPYCWTAATSVALMLLPLLFSAAVSVCVCACARACLLVAALFLFISYVPAFLMAAGSLADAFISGHSAYYLAIATAFLTGIGFGAFQSVDFALVMDVLPEEQEKAKDIAVWHQALVLPQALATPIGGLVLDLFERVNCQRGLRYKDPPRQVEKASICLKSLLTPCAAKDANKKKKIQIAIQHRLCQIINRRNIDCKGYEKFELSQFKEI
ncbi:hypothetical protein C0Q70_01760 [Pomacea canaliculata]|uniref:Major facilitator superfamily (MFS) profile domain-containing protein n=1 Tax=Pomacea canaliculata TaxID=400727 RepID=A0A2T7Q0D4_POMCA|nr:hypothetical protein C0Q70_01760 [Pomacea canaliculata]